MGAPKATDTPAADAADRTCNRRKKHEGLPSAFSNPHAVLVLMPNLSFLGLVFAVFGKEVGKDVAAATGDMDQRTLLPKTKT